jgi:hypothetical protein
VNKDILKTIPCNTKNSQTNHAPRFECSLSSEKVSQKVVDICMLYKNKQAARIEKAKHSTTPHRLVRRPPPHTQQATTHSEC